MKLNKNYMKKENLETLLFFAGFIFIAIMDLISLFKNLHPHHRVREESVYGLLQQVVLSDLMEDG